MNKTFSKMPQRRTIATFKEVLNSFQLSRLGLLMTIVVLELSLGLIAIFLPYPIVLFLLTLITVGIILTTRIEWASYFIIFFVPLYNVKFQYDRMPQYAEFAIINILCLLALIGLVLNRIADRKEYAYQKSFLDIPLFSFVFWALLSIYWTSDPDYAFFKWILLSLSFGLYYLMVSLVKDEQDIKKAVNMWIFLGVIIGIIGLLSMFFQENRQTIEIGENLSLKFSFGTDKPRASGFAEAKVVASCLNIAILFIIGNIVAAKERKNRVLLILLAFFLFFCQFFTQSKGPLGGLLVAIAILMIALRPLRAQLIRNLHMGGFCAVIIFILFSFALWGISTYREFGLGFGSRTIGEGSTEISLSTRIEFWGTLLEAIKDHNAYIFGLGVGSNQYYLSPVPHAHSIYMAIFSDFGLLGLAIFFLTLVIIIAHFYPVLKKEENYPRIMLWSFCAGMIALGINALVDFEYSISLIWVFLGFGMAIYRICIEEPKSTS